MTDKINRKDIILLLLYAPGISGEKAEPIRGITRFTKLLFLLKAMYNLDKEVKNYYSFEPFKLGPFTDELYDDLDFLKNVNLINVKAKEFINESELIETEEVFKDLLCNADTELFAVNSYNEYEYSLTNKGIMLAEKIYATVTDFVKLSISTVKQKFGALPLTEILRFIYRKYPEMAIKSIRADLRSE